MQSPTKIINYLKQTENRISPQRRVIMELLYNDTSHPNIQEIYRRAKARMPKISKSTVYKIVNELESIGELRKLDFVIGSFSRYDTNIKPHDHLFCIECKRIIDLQEDSNTDKINSEKLTGFKIKKGQVTFTGICPDCLKKQNHSESTEPEK